MIEPSRILYEDNHLIAVNKRVGELVQGDQTGDRTLMDDVKEYLKVKYNKPGNVYLGLPHRLDRPTSGVILFAKTEKALTRLSEQFKGSDIKKTYWAIVDEPPMKEEGTLVHFLTRDTETNKSKAYSHEVRGSKIAKLNYRMLSASQKYYLLEIDLLTGRHHQIRAQLAALGIHIKGDLKYGAPRSNPDGGICLHSRKIVFTHPVKKIEVEIIAPVPKDNLWRALTENLKGRE